MEKKKSEIQTDIIEKKVEAAMPKFIGPNGGSLIEIQEEIKKIYALIQDLVDSIKPSAWNKTEDLNKPETIN